MSQIDDPCGNIKYKSQILSEVKDTILQLINETWLKLPPKPSIDLADEQSKKKLYSHYRGQLYAFNMILERLKDIENG